MSETLRQTNLIPVLCGKAAQQWIENSVAPVDDSAAEQAIENGVREIINSVKKDGDRALAELAERFKDSPPQHISLNTEALEELTKRLPEKTRQTLEGAAASIKRFAQAVVEVAKPVTVDCGEYQAGFDFKPVERAACYIPAGRYPLPSTALMTAITAQVAGVKDIFIISPSLRDEILYAGSLAGVTEFHQVGGAQAVAAAAYGTANIKAADIIVGPGNAYVTEAKRQVYGTAGIDMLAGPSEVAIIADGSAKAEWLALDLLSQAEHDPNARAYLFIDDAAVANQVAKAIDEQVKSLQLPDYITISLGSSVILVLDSIEDCIAAANKIAPEHLQVQVKDSQAIKSKLKNYGALFMGYHATVPYGDYAAGPNHTLPTNRAARFSGGLNPFTFLRGQSWVKISQTAPNLAKLTGDFADIEGLIGHAAAARARLS